MEFEYQGKQWLRGGFQFPGMLRYIEDTREKLSQPLHVPLYATAGESQRLQVISEQVKKNPYLSRARFNEAVKRNEQTFSHVQSVSFLEKPALYDICVFTANYLMKMTPLVLLYTSAEAGYMYNAFAIDYQDKVWIYFSNQLFSEHGMLKDEELCYLVGHELGHAQCHHSTITSVSRGKNSDKEYSADRAGLIACAEWLRRKHPEHSIQRIAELAVLHSAATLQKLENGYKNGPGKTNWAEFDYESLQKGIDEVFRGAGKLTVSQGTHPHDKHRIMAMIHFSQSQLFYRCLGLDPEAYQNLYTDRQLEQAMAPMLANG